MVLELLAESSFKVLSVYMKCLTESCLNLDPVALYIIHQWKDIWQLFRHQHGAYSHTNRETFTGWAEVKCREPPKHPKRRGKFVLNP